MKTLTIQTHEQREILNITREVEEVVRESNVKEGTCLVFTPHATAAIILNEFEPNIASDYLKFFEKIAPKSGEWKHNVIDDNAEAHLLSAFVGSSVSIPISGGELVLGTWQSILLCEFDGPRSRRVIVQVRGE